MAFRPHLGWLHRSAHLEKTWWIGQMTQNVCFLLRGSLKDNFLKIQIYHASPFVMNFYEFEETFHKHLSAWIAFAVAHMSTESGIALSWADPYSCYAQFVRRHFWHMHWCARRIFFTGVIGFFPIHVLPWKGVPVQATACPLSALLSPVVLCVCVCVWAGPIGLLFCTCSFPDTYGWFAQICPITYHACSHCSWQGIYQPLVRWLFLLSTKYRKLKQSNFVLYRSAVLLTCLVTSREDWQMS